MPTYVVGCECGHTQDIFRKIAERNDCLPEHCGVVMKHRLCAPMVRSDEQEIKSMVDGKMYRSRGAYRAHLKEHGMIEMGNDAPGVKEPIERKPIKPPPGLKEKLIQQVYEKLPNH